MRLYTWSELFLGRKWIVTESTFSFGMGLTSSEACSWASLWP
jgi:hypothetical protein